MDKGLIIRILGFTLIPILFCGLSSLVMRENEKEGASSSHTERIIIKPPKVMCLVAAIEMLICTVVLIIITLFPNGTESIPFTDADSPMVFLIFSLFDLFGVCFLYATLIWRIEVFKNEDFFILRDYWGQRHEIHYSDCTSYQYRHHGQEIIVRNRIKNFTISYLLVNCEFLIAAMQRYNVKREKDC